MAMHTNDDESIEREESDSLSTECHEVTSFHKYHPPSGLELAEIELLSLQTSDYYLRLRILAKPLQLLFLELV